MNILAKRYNDDDNYLDDKELKRLDDLTKISEVDHLKFNLKEKEKEIEKLRNYIKYINFKLEEIQNLIIP